MCGGAGVIFHALGARFIVGEIVRQITQRRHQLRVAGAKALDLVGGRLAPVARLVLLAKFDGGFVFICYVI
jgi:hypothetical protein